MTLTDDEKQRLVYLETLFGKLTIAEIEAEIKANRDVLQHLSDNDPASRRYSREVTLLLELKTLVEKQVPLMQ